MNEKTLQALVHNGAIKKVRIIASGSKFHIELYTIKETIIAETNKGKIKTWSSLDTAAKWLRNLGIGSTEVSLDHWQPAQKSLIV